MIRLATLNDLPDIKAIAEGTGMFLGDELESFIESMKSHLTSSGATDAYVPTLAMATEGENPDSPVVGAAYFAPEIMAQGVVNLLFIGVLPSTRQKGVGGTLLAYFEKAARNTGARLAIIETASDEMFAPAWALYKSHGYEEEARVRDFYDKGLDKVIFRKQI